MPPHRDDRHPNPEDPHNTPWRFLASVIYLNDDYEGGEIYFPDQGMSIKPKHGQLIAFPGAWWHGVTAVSNGLRYTSPAWYSRDPRHEARI
jgi:predicted 2-oxoglutarate/Fe(II)-dependent dioxygenase YbiX